MLHRIPASPLALLLAAVVFAVPQPAAAQDVRIFNTVKQKLAAGQKVIGVTITTPDPDIYCAAADAGFDFVWIEMQHSPLTYSEVARMIWACRGAAAIPFIRVPGPTEGDIQKATDIGALGIIIPMVESVEEIRNAVAFAHYPPLGRRSQGNGQYGALWGNDYRAAANENVMIVAMIENPTGVAIAKEVASVEGVDVVFVASSDLGSFTGLPQGHPEYERLASIVKDATLEAGLALGGPLAWMSTRPEYNFFQAPTAVGLVRSGASVVLKAANPCFGVPAGVAPVEGADPCH
jgi:2-keto-3-deoxy-L-rhamnonate aldolase RhmA